MAARPSSAAEQRSAMVERTVVARGVRDPRVIEAMKSVERERFVRDEQAGSAYADHPLPIGSGQTISQPYIVALMAEAAEIGAGDEVLEIGTGSGYGAAVLSHLARHVVTIERHQELAQRAAAVLDATDERNVDVVVGDGSDGWPSGAPYDAIVVTAAAPRVPEALLEQLADGGRLVIPVGRQGASQELVVLRRDGDDFNETDLGPVAFVPLIRENPAPP